MMMVHALALCVALLAPPPTAASAFCTCAGPTTDAAAIRHNDAVFEGRVLRSRRVRYRDGFRGIVYTFAVSRWRKGTPSRTVDVVTGEGGGDCGVEFDRGRTHTVYASRNGAGRLATDICSGPYLPAPAPPPPLSNPRDR